MYYCAECAYFDAKKFSGGQAPCERTRYKEGKVPANQKATDCPFDGFVKCWSSRSEIDCNKLIKTAKDFGFYILSSLINKISVPGEVMDSFKYLYDDYMKNDEKYTTLVEYYEIYGPYLAAFILTIGDDEYLYSLKHYLLDMHESIVEGKLDKAVHIYFNLMINDIVDHYKLNLEELNNIGHIL